MSHTLLSAILTISLVPVMSRDGREEPMRKVDMAAVEADVWNCLNIGKEKAITSLLRTKREAVQRLNG